MEKKEKVSLTDTKYFLDHNGVRRPIFDNSNKNFGISLASDNKYITIEQVARATNEAGRQREMAQIRDKATYDINLEIANASTDPVDYANFVRLKQDRLEIVNYIARIEEQIESFKRQNISLKELDAKVDKLFVDATDGVSKRGIKAMEDYKSFIKQNDINLKDPSVRKSFEDNIKYLKTKYRLDRNKSRGKNETSKGA